MDLLDSVMPLNDYGHSRHSDYKLTRDPEPEMPPAKPLLNFDPQKLRDNNCLLIYYSLSLGAICYAAIDD